MESKDAPRITSEELKLLKDQGNKVVLIDTRNNIAYNAEHIQGAINIYYDPSGYSMERELMLSSLPGDAVLVPYCDCEGDHTSAIIALELLDLRYDADKVKVLKDGILRWKELGYPMEAA